MTLSFPNQSRSYDPTRRRVRFSGYDGALEIQFFVEVDALSVISSPKHVNEAEYLAAFDLARNSIQEVAREAYSHGRRTWYELTVRDFR